jgi:hypothetical protein
MKGIYLTEEGKKEIEDRITRLESINMYSSSINQIHQNELINAVYKEILKVSTIIPVVSDWESVSNSMTEYEKSYFPNGLIIQS